MVVCFVGFQGIVPQSWNSAAAVSPNQIRTSSSVSSSDDGLSPTGFVGASLLVPLGGLNTLDGLAATKARIGVSSIKSGDTDAKVKTATTGGLNRPSARTLFAPLDELTPTSSFGFRTSPITGEPGEFHTGQDYSAPCGTLVYSVDAGTVRAVGWHQWGGGNRVEVDHGNGLITSYNHLQGVSVEVGDIVNGGDSIAEVGTTGSSTGCHLHFETILDGEHVDPLGWTLVPTGHGARKGELKDYTPGGSGSSDIPAWAQSSTRSDQSVPAWDALPIAPGASEDTGRLPVASGASGNAGVPAGQERDEPSTPQMPTVPESEEPPRENLVSNAGAEKTEPLVRQTPPQQRVPVPPTPSAPPKQPDVKSPQKPDTKPDVTPGATPDLKPGVTPDVKLGATPDVKPDTKPGATPDVTPTPGATPGATPPDSTDNLTCDTDSSADPPLSLPGGPTPADPTLGGQPIPGTVTPDAQAAEGATTAAPASPAGGTTGSDPDAPKESEPTDPSCEDPDASLEASPGADTAPAPVEGDPAAPAPAQPTDGATTPARKQG